jgi:alkaline phosphatase
MDLSRRRIIQLGSAGAVAAAIPAATIPTRRASAQVRAPGGGRRAMNIIFMVADGMSFGTLTLADACHRQRYEKHSTWVSLFNEKNVRRSTAFTYSADSLVTDSAAGATAWGIGERVNNHAICFTPDNRTPTPLWLHAKQQGKAVGLVTTTTITHATPAGFIANCPDRDLEKDIGEQLLDRGFDVALGGGSMFFPDATLKKYPGVTIARDTASLRGADASAPLLGLFSEGHTPYTLDRPETSPDLEEMTRAALSRLLKSPNGFVLLVEGGRVDHAAHANDAASLVHDLLAFDRAVNAVWELTRDRSDTLVIITTDHGNANPALTKSSPKTLEGVQLLNGARRSFEWIFRESLGQVMDSAGVPLADQRSPEAIAGRLERLTSHVKEHLHVSFSKDERETLALALAGKPVDPFTERQSLTCVLGSLLANHNLVSFLSSNHTSDMVEVTSWGPGSDTIPAMINNFDLHGIAVKSLDLAPAKPV